MALDAETQAFLDLAEAEIAPWTTARAAERGLSLPAEALPAVIDNIALLQSQTRLFVAALGEAAGEAPEPFQP
ncbi:hypothetical protein [Caulobacter segnis]|uniref:hypothetical protein n=1 Tax=Caulobacter segnis TaxID=88688 RepID=UPI0028587262|nr:hypothetical protein [Caulobacter segnis]MDR6627973.1 hypothetical protein [Caulobacter segnis]